MVGAPREAARVEHHQDSPLRAWLAPVVDPDADLGALGRPVVADDLRAPRAEVRGVEPWDAAAPHSHVPLHRGEVLFHAVDLPLGGPRVGHQPAAKGDRVQGQRDLNLAHPGHRRIVNLLPQVLHVGAGSECGREAHHDPALASEEARDELVVEALLQRLVGHDQVSAGPGEVLSASVERAAPELPALAWTAHDVEHGEPLAPNGPSLEMELLLEPALVYGLPQIAEGDADLAPGVTRQNDRLGLRALPGELSGQPATDDLRQHQALACAVGSPSDRHRVGAVEHPLLRGRPPGARAAQYSRPPVSVAGEHLPAGLWRHPATCTSARRPLTSCTRDSERRRSHSDT